LAERVSVGLGPEGIATDGASVFVANQFSNTVTKLPRE
jgi:DNA-binding beta-propeller fold protein YncE